MTKHYSVVENLTCDLLRAPSLIWGEPNYAHLLLYVDMFSLKPQMINVAPGFHFLRSHLYSYEVGGAIGVFDSVTQVSGTKYNNYTPHWMWRRQRSSIQKHIHQREQKKTLCLIIMTRTHNCDQCQRLEMPQHWIDFGLANAFCSRTSQTSSRPETRLFHL